MPRENIISGGLEGDGIEGHKKRATEKYPASDSFDTESLDRNEVNRDPFDTESDNDRKEKKAPAEKSKIITKDIFETDFGSARSKKEYHKSSSIGSDSDIFSNGFGSKDAGWMSGRGRKSPEKQQEVRAEAKKAPFSEKKETGDIFETSIASHPLETGDKKEAATLSDTEEKKESKDPFYTGFGYTDQRKPKSSPPRSPVKTVPEKFVSSKKTEEEKVKKILDEDDDDLFS